MKTIHSFTETHTLSYPGYLTVTEHPGERFIFSVRSRSMHVPSVVEMSRDQLEALHAEIGARLAPVTKAKGE